ncbi:YfhO family protein [Levilactobacillus brevis]|nr:YfhO family protein [Levilactobacillus brevis]
MEQHHNALAKLRVSRWVYLGAFLIPLVIMCVVFWQLKVTPFGKHSLLFSDTGAQYIPILEYLRSTVTHGQFHLFSFALGTGSSMVPLLTYYVISPFNLLIFLFPAAQLPTAVAWIMILKISTIGLTMAVFLRHAFLRSGWSLLLFSTAFSLCGFVAMYFYDIMWLDALIWLPLVALGLHRIVSTHHFGLYTLSLTITIFSNYYLGYMTCLFSVMYFIYLIVEHQPVPTPFKETWRMHWPAIRQFIIGSLLAGLMSMIVLIPTALGMMLTGKSNFFVENYLPTPLFGPEVLAQFGVGTGNFNAHLYHAPSLFMGTLMFLLLIVYFVSPKIKAVEKTRTMWLLIAMGLSLFVTLFNTIWHMFQQPAGFPFRNVYFFTFLALITAYRAWQTHPDQTMNDPQKFLALLWGAGLLTIGFASAQFVPQLWSRFMPSYNNTLYANSQPNFHLLWLALGLLLLNTMLVFITEWRPIRIGLMVLIISGELGSNLYLASQGMDFGSETKFEKYFKKDSALLDKINASSTKFNLHRVDYLHSTIGNAYSGPYNHYNDPLMLDYAGLSSYSSTLDEQSRVFQHDLGYFSPNVRRISAQGYTHLTDTLFSVKYRLNANNRQPISKLDSYAGLGFAVPTKLADVQLRDQTALFNQQMILEALGAKPDTLARATVLDVTSHKASATEGNRVAAKRNAHTGPRYVQTFKLRVNATGLLHGYSPTTNVIYSSLLVNGKKAKPMINADGTRYVFKLGQHTKGEVLTVSYVTTQPQVGYSNEFVSLDQAKYVSLAQSLKQQRFKLNRKSGVTWLSGNVTGSAQRRLLYVSIPDTPGWQATVNGKPVKIRSAMHAQSIIPVVKNYRGMIGVPIHVGKNHVVLTYTTPGLKIGALLSALGAAIFAFLVITGEWRRSIRRKRREA